MQITKSIKLDFACHPFSLVVYAKQGDVNSRFLEVVPLNNGRPYIIPDGITARFACEKPDGHHVFNECLPITNNTIVVPLTEQTLAVEGQALATVILFDDVNQSVLSTQNFTLQIEANPIDGANIESTDEYQALISSLIEAEAAAAAALRRAEEAIQRAEVTAAKVNATVEGIPSYVNDLFNDLIRVSDVEPEDVPTGALWVDTGIVAQGTDGESVSVASIEPTDSSVWIDTTSSSDNNAIDTAVILMEDYNTVIVQSEEPTSADQSALWIDTDE